MPPSPRSEERRSPQALYWKSWGSRGRGRPKVATDVWDADTTSKRLSHWLRPRSLGGRSNIGSAANFHVTKKYRMFQRVEHPVLSMGHSVVQTRQGLHWARASIRGVSVFVLFFRPKSLNRLDLIGVFFGLHFQRGDDDRFSADLDRKLRGLRVAAHAIQLAGADP